MLKTLLFATLTFAVKHTGEIKEMELPSHPRLLYNRDGIAHLKERIDKHNRAEARWDRIKRNADRLLTESVELPPRGGNWWYWYACPKHGAALRTGKQISEWQWEAVYAVNC